MRPVSPSPWIVGCRNSKGPFAAFLVLFGKLNIEPPEQAELEAQEGVCYAMQERWLEAASAVEKHQEATELEYYQP